MEKEEKIVLQKNIKDAEKKTMIYLGPTILGVITENNIFKGDLPEKIQNAVKEIPVMKSLFVPIENLISAKKELKESHSAKSICYNKMLEYKKEKMNE